MLMMRRWLGMRVFVLRSSFKWVQKRNTFVNFNGFLVRNLKINRFHLNSIQVESICVLCACAFVCLYVNISSICEANSLQLATTTTTNRTTFHISLILLSRSFNTNSNLFLEPIWFRSKTLDLHKKKRNHFKWIEKDGKRKLDMVNISSWREHSLINFFWIGILRFLSFPTKTFYRFLNTCSGRFLFGVCVFFFYSGDQCRNRTHGDKCLQIHFFLDVCCYVRDRYSVLFESKERGKKIHNFSSFVVHWTEIDVWTWSTGSMMIRTIKY